MKKLVDKFMQFCIDYAEYRKRIADKRLNNWY